MTATDEVLGTDAGSVTTGSFGAIALGSLDWSAGTLDLLNDATISAANFNLGGGTLTLTSQTLNTLTATGGTITAATPTLVNQTLPLVFTGPKSDAYRLLPRMFRHGDHVPDAGIAELRGKLQLSIEADRPLPVLADGAYLGTTPAAFQLVPRSILLKL
mgnify:CR=1 FL=1